MKNKFYQHCLILLILALNMVSCNNDNILDTNKKSVLKIINLMMTQDNKIKEGSEGTGFLINKQGYLLTNNHVIEAIEGTQARLLVVDGDDTSKENLKQARLIWRSKTTDLAIIKVDNLSQRPVLKFADKMPLVGDEIFAIGYPGVTSDRQLNKKKVKVVVTNGILSVVLEDGVEGIATTVLQHNVPVNPGNSGGPLLDACGNVIGINTQAISRNAGRLIHGVFYSSHISASIKELNQKGIDFNLEKDSCQPEMTSGLYGVITSIIGIIIALIAIVFSMKKPREKIIKSVETYTQYLRRTGKRDPNHPHTKQPEAKTIITTAPPSSATKNWTLTGQVKTTKEPLELILSDAELRQGITFGRSQKLCDYSIPEKKLSRRHIKMSYHSKGIQIEDFNSSNGTYIDAHRVKPSKPELLKTGSTLNLSNVIVLTLK